jgi:hypothetical protein
MTAKRRGRRRSRTSPNDRRDRGSRQHRQDGVGFWGDADKLPPERLEVRMTAEPAAVPRSLGPPPLPGHEAIAEHYLQAVYDRAVTTAGALAAAGGMIDPEALAEELGQ